MGLNTGNTVVQGDFSQTSTGVANIVPKTNTGGFLSNTFLAGLFGDGSDSTVLLDGTNTFSGLMSKSGNTYTLLRDVYATTLTVNTGVTLITGNWRIFCTVAITGAGTIKQDGNNGSNGSYSSGVASGASAITGYFTTPKGGDGAAGNGTSSPTSGDNANPSPKSSAAASGGNGSGGSGGAGGGSNTIYKRFYALLHEILFGMDHAAPSPYKIQSGAGAGGGGNGNSGSYSGGGGSGATAGGVVWIIARTWSGTFTIQAIGGTGGNGGNGGGSSGSGNDKAGGGGGGGDGGFAFIAYLVKTWTGSYTLTAGNGGTHGTQQSGSGGVNGSNGVTGQSLEVNLSTSV